MKENHFFDNLKERLQNHESPIQLDDQWHALQLRKKEKRRKKLLGFLILPFLLAGLGTVGYFVKQLLDRPSNNSTVVSVANSSTASDATTLLNGSNAFTYEKQTLVSPSVELTERPNTQTSANQVTTNSKNLLSLNERNHQALLSISNKDAVNNNPKQANLQTVNNTSESDLSSRNDAAAANSEQSEDEKVVAVSGVENNRGDLPLSQVNNSTRTKYLVPDLISTRGIMEPFTVKNEEPTPTILQCKVQNNRLHRFSVHAATGVMRTSQSFTAKSSDNNDLADLRKRTQTPLETFALDLGVSYRFTPKAYIDFGGSYYNWTDRIDFNFERPKAYTLENQLLRVERNSTLNTESLFYGDTTVMGSQSVQVKQFNTYISSSLRMLLGYSVLSHQKWSLDVQSGLEWNLRFTGVGKVAGSPTELMDIQGQDGSSIYRTSLGMGVRGGLQLNYILNQRLMLQVRPTAIWHFTDASAANNLVASKFFRFGTNVGLSYRF